MSNRVKEVASHLALSAGLALGLVAAPIVAGAGAAVASPIAAHHDAHGGGKGSGHGIGNWGVPPGGSWWGHAHHADHHLRLVVGTVSNPGSTGFTLTTERGKALTIDVTASTKYIEPGVTGADASDVLAGDRVWVAGSEPQEGTLDALGVFIPLVRYAGAVSSTNLPGSFTISVPGRPLTGTSSTLTATATTVTVNLSNTTVISEPHVASPTVQVGDHVRVAGQQDGALTVNAIRVWVAPPEGHHGHGPGDGPGGAGGAGQGSGGNGGRGHHHHH